jgi:hypothetical protein
VLGGTVTTVPATALVGGVDDATTLVGLTALVGGAVVGGAVVEVVDVVLVVLVDVVLVDVVLVDVVLVDVVLVDVVLVVVVPDAAHVLLKLKLLGAGELGVMSADEPLVWRSVSAFPAGTAMNTLSCCEPFGMMSDPLKMYVVPPTFSVIVTNV